MSAFSARCTKHLVEYVCNYNFYYHHYYSHCVIATFLNVLAIVILTIAPPLLLRRIIDICFASYHFPFVYVCI